MTKTILSGAGGSSGSGNAPIIKSDNLLSKDVVEFTLGVCEGPIGGLHKGPQSFFLGDTPLVSKTGENNFDPFELHVYHGEAVPSKIKNALGGTSSNYSVGVTLAQYTPVTRITPSALRGTIDQLDVRIQIAQLVEANDSGDQLENTANFAVRYREAGETEWRDFYGPEDASRVSIEASEFELLFYLGLETASDSVVFSSGESLTTSSAKRGNLGTELESLSTNPAQSVDTSKLLPVGAWADTSKEGYNYSVTKTYSKLYYSHPSGDYLVEYLPALSTVEEKQVESYPIEHTDIPGSQACKINVELFKAGLISITGKTTSGYIKELVRGVPRINNDWEIQVEKFNPDNDEFLKCVLNWESYQATTIEDRSYPNLAVVRGLGKASDQFSSIPTFSGVYACKLIKVPSNYNPVTRYYDGVWDGTFKLAHSDNLAWCAYDLLDSSVYGLRAHRPDLSINRYSFYDAAQWCDVLVPREGGGYQPRYTYNDKIEQARDAMELFYQLVGIMGAVPLEDMNGTISLKVDKPGVPLQIFGPESVGADGFNYSFTAPSSRPNDITVKFVNPMLDFATDVRRIYDQGLIDRNGRVPEEIVALGCNDASEAQRRAQMRLIRANTEVMSVSFNTARMGFGLELFELIGIVDPHMNWGVSGRVKTAPFSVIQAGQVTIPAGADNQPFVVKFDAPVASPIVAVTAGAGSRPLMVRTTEKSDAGFSIVLDEPVFEDGIIDEDITVNWVAVAEGNHTLPSGQKVEARSEIVSETTQEFLHTTDFGGVTPLAFATIASDTTGLPLYVRNEVNSLSNWLRLQHEEGQTLSVGQSETVDILLFEPSVNTTTAIVTSNASTLALPGTFSNPVSLADMQSFNGSDACRIAVTDFGDADITLRIEEEWSDGEIIHAGELVGVIVFEAGVQELVTPIKLRDPLYLPVGVDLDLTLQTNEGPVDLTVQTSDPATLELTVTSGVWPPNTPSHAQFALSHDSIGMVKPFRIMAIQEDNQNNELLMITAIESNVNKQTDADNMTLSPVEDYASKFANTPPAPFIKLIESGTKHLVKTRGGGIDTRIYLEWDVDPTPPVESFFIYYRRPGVDSDYQTIQTKSTRGYIPGVIDGETYEIFVLSENPIGIRSRRPRAINRHTVIGKTEVPPNAVIVGTAQKGPDVRVDIEALNIVDFDHFEVRIGGIGDSWETAEYVGQTGTTSFLDRNIQTSPVVYFVKAVDTTGYVSETAAEIQHDVPIPSAPLVQIQFTQTEFHLEITPSGVESVPLSEYVVYDGVVEVFRGKTSSFTGNANWLGLKTFNVKTINQAGVESPLTSVEATISAPASPNLSSYIAETTYYLQWAIPASTLPISHYIVTDVTNSVVLESRSPGMVYSGNVNWFADREFSIQAVDTAGNLGGISNVTVTAEAPEVTGLVSSVSRSQLKLSWSGSRRSLPIQSYEVLEGASFATATSLGVVDAETFSLPVSWNGSKTFYVVAKDTAGNLSTPASVVETIDPPSQPTVTAEIVDQNIHLSWTGAETELQIATYTIESTYQAQTKTIQTVQATAVTIPAKYLGDVEFSVTAKDEAGNTGIAGTAMVNIAAPNPFEVTGAVEGSNVTVSWATPISDLPIAHYELTYGPARTFLAKLSSNSFTLPASWLGGREFYVKAYDTAGNASPEQPAEVVILAPSAPSVRTEVLDNNVLLRWFNGAGSLPVAATEIRRGPDFATAEVLQQVDATFAAFFEFNAGTYTYWAVNIDTAGNYGTAAQVRTVVSEPPDFVLQDQFTSDFSGLKSNLIVNEEGSLLMGLDPTQTFEQHFGGGASQVSMYPQLYEDLGAWPNRGNNALFAFKSVVVGAAPHGVLFESGGATTGCAIWFDSSDSTFRFTFGRGSTASTDLLAKAEGDATSLASRTLDIFVAVRPGAPGRAKAYIYDHDTGENLLILSADEATGQELNTGIWAGSDGGGVGKSVAAVTQWLTTTDQFNGTMSGGMLHIVNVLPVDFDLETDPGLDYFKIFATPQDQIEAGFPIYIQPTDESLDSYYEEEFDLLGVISSSIITVSPTVQSLYGSGTVAVDIWVRETALDPWQEFLGQSQVYAQNFQFMKVRVRYIGTGPEDLVQLERIDVRMNVKLRNDAGSGYANAGDAGGTPVNFNVNFVDVASITVTPNTTTSCFAVYDFEDTQNPTGFTVLLFDTTGSRISGDFSWAVRGY